MYGKPSIRRVYRGVGKNCHMYKTLSEALNLTNRIHMLCLVLFAVSPFKVKGVGHEIDFNNTTKMDRC